MNLFTRITATIGATAETAVSRFENHEAIAQSALLEARQAVTKARIRHQRLIHTVSEIRSGLKACEQQMELWTTRAQKLAKTDEERAIQCLEQRQICREQLDNYRQDLSKHESLEANMSDRLKQLETRLQTMNNQCQEMRSRESIAQATQVMDRVDSGGNDGVDAIFERWELSVSQSEIHNSVKNVEGSSVSSLQRQMDEEERKATLKGELAALVEQDEELNHE